ncbi:MAG TPA: protein-L-isoaspartate O-methyltransferase [Gammaproteobacteria bacterium]|jgi:protein-L-isoaspartate(D-aspartate) O-methyltransferase|nr:protein-L-isoaspartate O-methyltransferase [Gammaproteobacteria bacterium]
MAAVSTEFEAAHARKMMVERQVRTWDVLDQRITDLLEEMPRDRFVPERFRALAYADAQIPLGDGQIMMAPKVEGRMLQALAVQPGESVLEVGTGSGFIAACLARLGGNVLSCDNRAAFLGGAQKAIAELGLADQVELRHQDSARLDWTEQRFDVICVTGSVPVLDNGFAEHLETGGRLFVVVGQAPVMEAILITRIAAGELARESLFETVLPALDNAPAPSPFRF